MLQAAHHTTHNYQDAHKTQHTRVIIKAVLRDGKATDKYHRDKYHLYALTFYTSVFQSNNRVQMIHM
jgi:hypothetical protein